MGWIRVCWFIVKDEAVFGIRKVGISGSWVWCMGDEDVES